MLGKTSDEEFDTLKISQETGLNFQNLLWKWKVKFTNDAVLIIYEAVHSACIGTTAISKQQRCIPDDR